MGNFMATLVRTFSSPIAMGASALHFKNTAHPTAKITSPVAAASSPPAITPSMHIAALRTPAGSHGIERRFAATTASSHMDALVRTPQIAHSHGTNNFIAASAPPLISRVESRLTAALNVFGRAFSNAAGAAGLLAVLMTFGGCSPVEFKKGTVTKESGTATSLTESSGAILGNESVKIDTTYILTVQTNVGTYYIDVTYGKRSLPLMAERIDVGTMIEFPVTNHWHDNLFRLDNMASLSSDQIRILNSPSESHAIPTTE